MEMEQLKQRLKQYGDYDEIKRELEIMKVLSVYNLASCTELTYLQYVEFAGLDEDAEEGIVGNHGSDSDLQLPNPNADKANAHHGKSLEALLSTKNKRILEELTKIRVRLSQLMPKQSSSMGGITRSYTAS
jgi:homeobox protein cut-like